MCVCTYMYTLHHQKQKQKPRRSSGPKKPRYIKVPGINKVKVINYINKTKSKNFIGLNIDKRKPKNIRCLKKKTNNQTRQIIYLFVVSRYNFYYLKKLFIKSFS